jgi:MscS family membrane protein
LRRFIADIIVKLIKKIAVKYNIRGILLMVDSTEKPIMNFILFTGVYLAAKLFPLTQGMESFVISVYRALIIISITQCLLNIVSSYSVVLDSLYQEKNQKIKISKTLFPVLSKIIKTVIVLIAIVAIAVEFKFEQLNSILAGLGIGGAALALASQDLIKNFFGGFIVLTDKSFNVGDLIKIDSSEGIVEELGLRSTKIRTVGKELIVVPNSKFTDRDVINYTNRENRRVSFNVGVPYGTSKEKLKNITEKINNMLDSHEKVTEGSPLVKFDKFSVSSLEIIVQYLTNTADYNEFMDIKDDINFRIMDIFEEEGVSFAFPSMSIYMEKNDTIKQY